LRLLLAFVVAMFVAIGAVAGVGAFLYLKGLLPINGSTTQVALGEASPVEHSGGGIVSPQAGPGAEDSTEATPDKATSPAANDPAKLGSTKVGGFEDDKGDPPGSEAPVGAAPQKEPGVRPPEPKKAGGEGAGPAPPPDPSRLPTFLVSENTRQVYRVHLSGLHPSYATLLMQGTWPIIAKLPEDSPLRKAVLGPRSEAVLADEFRSARSKFLAAGVDTLYLVTETDWTASTELPGYIALASTPEKRDRLSRSLREAGHESLADFLRGFAEVKGHEGWLVRSPSDVVQLPTESESKARLVQHALENVFPLRNGSIAVARGPGIGPGSYKLTALDNTWPLTVVNLKATQLDQLLAPLVSALIPGGARMAQHIQRAESVSVSVSLVPFPCVLQVIHAASAAEARQLGDSIRQTYGAVMDMALGDNDPVERMLKGMYQLSIRVFVRGQDVVTMMKPPALFDLFAARKIDQEVRDQDWTALPAPAGYHWEVFGVPGQSQRYDVLDRVAAVRGLGDTARPAGPAGPLTGPRGTARFKVRLPDYDDITLSLDRRGEVKVEAQAGEKAPRAPDVECFDDQGRRVAVMRLSNRTGGLRFDLLRMQGLVVAAVGPRQEAEMKAWRELDVARNQREKDLMEAQKITSPPNPLGSIPNQVKQKWDSELRVRELAVLKETGAISLLTYLEGEVRGLLRPYSRAMLLGDAEVPEPNVDPLAAQRKKLRFAGRWLLEDGVVVCLYQDTQGRVVGTVSGVTMTAMPPVPKNAGQAPPPPSKRTGAAAPTRRAILEGQAGDGTLTFQWFALNGMFGTGRLVLEDGGLQARWESAETNESRVKFEASRRSPIPPHILLPSTQSLAPPVAAKADRLTDEAGVNYFGENTGDFAGYWVHSTQKNQNTLLKRGQLPGAYSGTTGPSTFAAFAAGNQLFCIQEVGRNPWAVDQLGYKLREAVLSGDGKKLTFDPVRGNAGKPGGFLPVGLPGPIELQRDE
jgi:hypothetical protein